MIELCPQASEVLNNFTPHLRKHGGSALIIDYGYAEPPLRSTLQALKAHQHHPVLEELGTADITAHVDFLMLFAKAESLGLIAEPPIAQGTWLEAMGIHIRAEQLEKNATPEQLMMIKSGLTRLIDPSQMGELFKVLCVRGK